MNEILSTSLFSFSGQIITVGQLLLFLAVIAMILYVYRLIVNRFYPKFSQDKQISDSDKRKLRNILIGIVVLLVVLVIISILNIDNVIYSNDNFELTLILVIKALLFLQFARLLDWIISNLFIHNYYRSQDQETAGSGYYNRESESAAKKIIQFIFYTIVSIFIIQNFNLDFTLFNSTFKEEVVNFKISKIFIAFLIFLIARLFVWIITQIVLFNVYRSKSMDVGSQYAINQLIKYVVYVFATIIALDSLGINMSILLTGAAALLVGVGLGLQQTFNDFISGIILLFERSVSIGDVLEFDNTVGTIKKIGLRASIVETRDNVSFIVPNHLLVTEKVTNWTHYSDKVRFEIRVGVAYKSDAKLVKALLLQTANDNPYVLEYPAPIVRLTDFGNSSLDFILLFFSKNYMVIEDIKSDIRLEINQKFTKNNITIPFPQAEIKIKQD